MPTFKENPEGMKPSGYKMKYKNSAFPFKSPLKHPTHKDHHEAKKLLKEQISEDKKKLLEKYPGGVMPL